MIRKALLIWASVSLALRAAPQQYESYDKLASGTDANLAMLRATPQQYESYDYAEPGKEFCLVPLTVTSPPSGLSGGAPDCNAGSDVPIIVDASQFPNWMKLAFYDGTAKLGEITQGTPKFTAKNLTPGYHVFSVLGMDAQGNLRASNPALVVMRRSPKDVDEQSTAARPFHTRC